VPSGHPGGTLCNIIRIRIIRLRMSVKLQIKSTGRPSAECVDRTEILLAPPVGVFVPASRPRFPPVTRLGRSIISTLLVIRCSRWPPPRPGKALQGMRSATVNIYKDSGAFERRMTARTVGGLSLGTR
jgi:hypothetical protein